MSLSPHSPDPALLPPEPVGGEDPPASIPDPDALYQRGLTAYQRGQREEAAECFRQALRLKPDYAEAHNNLGCMLQALDRLEDALACYRQAIRLKPDYAHALNNAGNALTRLGRLDEAADYCRQVLRVDPDYANAYNTLGSLLIETGDLPGAVAALRRALRLRPDNAEAHNNLGNALLAQKCPQEALACYREALSLDPKFAEAHNNMSCALLAVGHVRESQAHCEQALRLKPDYADAYNNLGTTLADQCRPAEAAASFERALRLRPDFPQAHMNRGLALLLAGDLEQGWTEYEWRGRCNGFALLPDLPVWDGAPLAGRTILLRAEQGFGDTIHFVRYAPLVKQRGGTVVLECQPPLATLLAGCAGVDRVVAQGHGRSVGADVQATLLSLPRLFGTTLATVPADVPYVHADEVLARDWRRELADTPGFKIGIVWQGSSTHPRDQGRSVPLGLFAPLADLPGVRLLSLQKGPGSEQIRQVPFPVEDLESRLDSFADTAAVVSNLDLVVSVDTAVVHLAGAMGTPVWMVLPFAPDWRWLLEREDSPWYPSLRLFRQTASDDWPGVFARVTSALQRLTGRPEAISSP